MHGNRGDTGFFMAPLIRSSEKEFEIRPFFQLPLWSGLLFGLFSGLMQKISPAVLLQPSAAVKPAGRKCFERKWSAGVRAATMVTNDRTNGFLFFYIQDPLPIT